VLCENLPHFHRISQSCQNAYGASGKACTPPQLCNGEGSKGCFRCWLYHAWTTGSDSSADFASNHGGRKVPWSDNTNNPNWLFDAYDTVCGIRRLDYLYMISEMTMSCVGLRTVPSILGAAPANHSRKSAACLTSPLASARVFPFSAVTIAARSSCASSTKVYHLLKSSPLFLPVILLSSANAVTAACTAL